MSSENKIYEITKMMADNRVIKGDVNHAANMVKTMLSEKYVAPITRAIGAENKKVRKNPSREARLLEAVKPFMDGERHPALNRAIDALHMVETLRGLSDQMPKSVHLTPKGITAAGLGLGGGSVHEDGIYDMDERCASHQGQMPLMPIFVVMAMAAMGR